MVRKRRVCGQGGMWCALSRCGLVKEIGPTMTVSLQWCCFVVLSWILPPVFEFTPFIYFLSNRERTSQTHVHYMQPQVLLLSEPAGTQKGEALQLPLGFVRSYPNPCKYILKDNDCEPEGFQFYKLIPQLLWNLRGPVNTQYTFSFGVSPIYYFSLI